MGAAEEEEGEGAASMEGAGVASPPTCPPRLEEHCAAPDCGPHRMMPSAR